MQIFRDALQEGPNLKIADTAIEALIKESKRLVNSSLSKQPQPRPSAIARELKAMSKGLERSAKATERLGHAGMLRIFAASNAQQIPEDCDPIPHVEYLCRMAHWASNAAETAALDSKSQRDDRGGRSADANLRDLVTQLMIQYQALLDVRPTHTVNPETGLGESLFDLFVKEAIGEYAPDHVYFEDRTIDDAIRWALPVRDLDYFLPPPFPDQ